jgi:hypothetical protein
MRFESSLSLYQCTLLPICTVATAVKAMCQYCCTVTVCHSNHHCHYISAHCYQYVRQPQLLTLLRTILAFNFTVSTTVAQSVSSSTGTSPSARPVVTVINSCAEDMLRSVLFHCALLFSGPQTQRQTMTCCTLTVTVQPLNRYTHMLSWHPNRCWSSDLRRFSFHSNYPLHPNVHKFLQHPPIKSCKCILVQQSPYLVSTVHTLTCKVEFHSFIHLITRGWSYCSSPRLAQQTQLCAPLPCHYRLLRSLPHLPQFIVPPHASPIRTGTFLASPSHSNRHATVSIPSHLSKLNNEFGCYSVQRCMNHTQTQLLRKASEAMSWYLHLVTSVYRQFKQRSLKAL